MSTDLSRYVTFFSTGEELPQAEAVGFFDALLNETDEAVIVETFRLWDDKGITENELFSLASIMRLRMRTIDTEGQTVLDIVGTGGSKSKTFNVSTAAAFVAAGAGVRI